MKYKVIGGIWGDLGEKGGEGVFGGQLGGRGGLGFRRVWVGF